MLQVRQSLDSVRLPYLFRESRYPYPQNPFSLPIDDIEENSAPGWIQRICLRCNVPDQPPGYQPDCWASTCPLPYCPTYRQFVQRLCIVSFILLSWGILYTEMGEEIGLTSELVSMAVMVICAYVVGWCWSKITTLPALIGMLVTGILFQQYRLVQMTDRYTKLNQDLRSIALIIILLRAGLGLDSVILKRNFTTILQLGILPWTAECIAIAISTSFALGLPWIWSFLLGTMIASVSPAVVVPCLFRLAEAGYGVNKGIPTILVAAAAIDDSISVALFSIILSTLFSTRSTASNAITGPFSIIAGLVGGTLWGYVVANIPEKGDKYVKPLRFLALLLGGLFFLFVSQYMEYNGAGPLAITSSGFIAATNWAKQGWPVNRNSVTNAFRVLWLFFEPVLFALTGASVKFSDLNPRIVVLSVICLVGCLVFRGIVTFLVSFGCSLNKKEKLFICLTWTAKATVQAALGSAALDLINNGKKSGFPAEDEESYARTILTISLLSVMISAPLGALSIALTGPRLLTQYPKTGDTIDAEATSPDSSEPKNIEPSSYQMGSKDL